MTRWSELSPRGAGGVSVLAVIGPRALEAVRALAPNARLAEGRPVLARLVDAGEWLDEALVCVHGSEHVELHLHGSPPLVRRVGRLLGGGDRRVHAAGPPGAEAPTEEGPARADEDDAAQRALAWRLLPGAACEAAARMLLDQAEGALARELARIEALPGAERSAARVALDERSRAARRLIDPARVLLAGPVNAGKSTLFNALLGRRRAITSEVAGTTRDLLREPAVLEGWPLVVIDAAGERAADEALERAGQALGRRARGSVDLVLRLRMPGAPRADSTEGEPPMVELAARGDRPDAEPDALRPLEDPVGARARVAAALRAALALPERPWTPGAGVQLAPPERRER